MARNPYIDLLRATGLACLAVTLSACTLLRIGQEVRLLDELGFVTGQVTTPEGSSEKIVVVLLREGPTDWEVEQIDPLSAGVKTYVFHLQAGASYSIAAFEDRNGDGMRDDNEPLGFLETAEPLRVEPHEWKTDRGFLVAEGRELPPGRTLDLRPHAERSLATITLHGGEVTSLDDNRFDPRQGRHGMWTPLHAGLEYGAGVFLLEPFDQDRIPVLFVHGIGGTPRDLGYLIEHLDRSRFQAWVFSYPSGMRLHRAKSVMVEVLDRLQEELGFADLVLTAHSMGGLISRDFVADKNSSAAARVRLLATFSTPWQGHGGAKYGVKWSPVVVPSWIDLHPGSEYLKNLELPLREGLPHILFFGFRMRGWNPVMPYSHDSAVSVASQLGRFFQEQATRISGYNLDHDEILADPDVAREYFLALDEATRDQE